MILFHVSPMASGETVAKTHEGSSPGGVVMVGQASCITGRRLGRANMSCLDFWGFVTWG